MTAQEYAAIAAACDRLLQAPEAGLERLAVPLLHVIKEHPVWLRQYRPAAPTGTAARPTSRWHALAARARAVLGALLRSARQSAAGMIAAAPAAPVQVLLVSHLTSPSQLNADEDAYFGSLQQSLQACGVSCRRLLIDHLRTAAARHECRAAAEQNQWQLLPRAVPLSAELRIWWRCVQDWRRLRRMARGSNDAQERAIALLAGREMLRGQTLANLRLHETIARICARLAPVMVVTTHEGDACERVIWHAARGMRRSPLCVGYQHALLSRQAHAIRRCLGRPHGAADPDVILTLGEISHALLAASPGLRSVQLIEYGSHRHVQPPGTLPWADRSCQCVVLPDADESECLLLFNFALACAQRCPDMTFVLRPHPIVDYPDLARRHPSLHQLPRNVRISSQTLSQECAQARYCLYRGSSAALHAVQFGAKPFYLARPEELVFDPLFSLDEWRETVNSPEEFERRARHAETALDLDAVQRAREECERYRCAVRPAALRELLALAGSGHRGEALDRELLNRLA